MNSNWLCIECGEVLGEVVGGEMVPNEQVPQKNIRTRGPNLVLTCPHCGSVKVWYTSDAIVRAMYQLVDALASQMARRTLSLISEQTLPHREK